jgi:hypothetical protein
VPLELGVLGEDAQDVEAVPGEQQVVGRPPAVGADLAVGVGELGEADLGRGRVGAGDSDRLAAVVPGREEELVLLGPDELKEWGVGPRHGSGRPFLAPGGHRDGPP